MVFERLPAARVLDDAWWLAVVVIASQRNNDQSEQFYDRLLP